MAAAEPDRAQPAPARRAPAGKPDVLIVSLGATAGLRVADEQLRASLERAGARVEAARARAPRELRTLMLTDLSWARAARHAALAGAQRAGRAKAVIYSSTTAALLWPRAGVIRFDSPAASNRAGRHGLWQRPLERRRFGEAQLLLPWSASGLCEAPRASTQALVVPVAVELSALAVSDAQRDIAALTYGANPSKKGLDVVLAAWARARREGEQLLVAGIGSDALKRAGLRLPPGARLAGMLAPADYRALLRRARVFVCGARREDYGIAQLEALGAGCQLVTRAAAGPYAALPIARRLDGRLVGEDLARALRVALDDPLPEHRERARVELEPFRRAAVDRVVAEQLLPRLLG